MRPPFLLFAVALSPAVQAQTARAVDVLAADNPPLALEDGPRLVGQLNRPWTEARDAFEVVVSDGRVHTARLDFSDDGPDFAGYAGRLRERHGAPPTDGLPVQTLIRAAVPIGP